MKKAISQQLQFLKYLIVVLILFFIIPLVTFSLQLINDELETIEPIVIIISFEVILWLFLWGLLSLKKLEFDSDSLYITKEKESEEIPLENIYGIKLIMLQIGNSFFWKIKYIDIHKKEKSVRLLPNSNFQKFKEIVKGKNKNVDIQNWSHSFDFD